MCKGYTLCRVYISKCILEGQLYIEKYVQG